MTLQELQSEIAMLAKRLKALRKQERQMILERQAKKNARNAEICKRFDSGANYSQIANYMGLSESIVRQTLWRKGKTKRAREAVRIQTITLQAPIR